METEVDHGDVDRRPARERAPGPADRLTRIPNASPAVQVAAVAVVAKDRAKEAGADNARR